MAFSGETAALYHRFLDGDREVRYDLIQHVDEYVTEVQRKLAYSSEDESQGYRAQDPDKLICRVVSLGDGPGAPGVEVAHMLREKHGSGFLRFEVCSSDLSEEMCQQARERATRAGFDEGDYDSAKGAASKSAVTMKFIAPLSADDSASLQERFPDASVDLVLMSFVLMFVDNRETCFAEVARMLRPGGKLLFCVLNKFHMIDVVSNALDELLRDEDMTLKLCRPIRPVQCLALKDWAVYEHNHIDGSDDEKGEGLERLLKIAAPSLKVDSWGITKYDFPLGCREGDEEIMLDMFCALISDDSWAAIAERAPHLNGSLDQAKREVRDYVNAVVTRSGKENRWRFDEDGKQYDGNAYCCPEYAAPVVCCEKPHEHACD